MAWFLNHYKCARCGTRWCDGWSCMCDDDCPECGARHMSPLSSDDLTEIITTEDSNFVVLFSPESASHHPDYQVISTLKTRDEVAAYLSRNR